MASYDVLGNIAIIKGEGKNKKQKLAQAKKLLKNPNIKTVVEKVGNVKGRLRTINVKHVAGERNLIAKHKENGCVFKFDVETCYFSGRLSNERKEIASKIRKKDKILVMFAGVGVYPIVIYKMKKPVKVVGVELGKDCCKYFKENLKLNKMVGKIEVIQGDVKRKMLKGKFDVVVMPRPNLRDSFLEWGLRACKKGGKIFYYGFCNIDKKKDRDSFLEWGLRACKKGGKIFYYGFCNIDKKKDMIGEIEKEAKGLKRKIKIMRVVKAGEIAPYKYRWMVEIRVL